MSIFKILKSHGINNPRLQEELQGFVTSLEVKEFENGVRQGKSTQAILELQGRDQFIKELQVKHNLLVQEIQEVVNKFK